MRRKSNLGWLVRKMPLRDRPVLYIFLRMGLIMILLGFLFASLYHSGAEAVFGVLAFWQSLGLFLIAMGFVHGVISAARANEGAQD